MPEIRFEARVALTPEAAWERLRDLSLADRYVPGITEVEFTTEAREGVGASRRVRQGDKLELDETVEDWRDGEAISLRLHRGEQGPIPPLTEHYFDYGIERRGQDTWLVNGMRYEVKPGVLGWLLDRLVLRHVLRRELRKVTLAQKQFYEASLPPPA